MQIDFELRQFQHLRIDAHQGHPIHRTVLALALDISQIATRKAVLCDRHAHEVDENLLGGDRAGNGRGQQNGQSIGPRTLEHAHAMSPRR
ncbi:hypothetical protein D3C71_2009730 [compost metagenome]